MSSNDIALRVENLGKMYRLGCERPKASGLAGKVKQGLGAPFEWLASQMRPPSEEETLWALKNVSFEIKRGEVVGFIGHNGAGKSTLLKILSRITEPTEGFAEIHGRIAALLEVGTGMHPELTGRENIFMNGTVLGMKKVDIDRNLDEIIDFSGIEKFLDTPVKRYSSGMRVRLGFAIAAHLEPEILVVDEVLAVGDADFQKRCISRMEDVASDGRSVLFVSHKMSSVRSLCSRAIQLDSGNLIDDGSTDQIIEQYLVGREKPSSNRLTGKISRKGTQQVILTSLDAFNDQGEESALWCPLQGGHFEFTLLNTGQHATNVDVAFSIHTQFGDLLTVSSLSDTGSGISLLEQETRTIKCVVNSLPFHDGRYALKTLVKVAGVHSDYITDYICHFEVLHREGMRDSHNNKGPIWIESEWGDLP